MQSKSPNKKDKRPTLPSTERVQEELAQAKSMDDFFGKEGIFARLFADTLEQMLEAELSEHLGYEPVSSKYQDRKRLLERNAYFKYMESLRSTS